MSLVSVDNMRLLVGVLAGFQAAILFLTTLGYWRIIRAGHPGAAPMSVTVHFIAYILVCIYILADIMSRLHQPLSWRTPLALIAFLLGCPSVLGILIFTVQRSKELL